MAKTEVKKTEVKKATNKATNKKEVTKMDKKVETKTNNKSVNAKEKTVEKEVVPFERQTRIVKSDMNKTFKYLYRNRAKLRFDLAIQRNEVWSIEQKSMLIHSILYGYPVPPVMVQETDDEFIWFLDGKQRLTTIIGFINGDWALSKKTPAVFGHEIAGFKFADLEKDMRDVIEEEDIKLIKLKNMTEEEVDTLFVRWNSGSGLSKIELTRAMHSSLIEQINGISALEFFDEDIALTGKAKNRFVDQEIILQIAMLMDLGVDSIKGFGSAHITDYVLNLKEEGKVLSDALIRNFDEISKYLTMAVGDFDNTERKKALKKIHVPIIFNTAQTAIKNKIKPALFGQFIRTFLITNYTIESDYGQSCQSGSSKRDNVVVRLHEMGRMFDEFMKTLEKDKGEEKAVEEFKETHAKKIEKQVEVNVKEEAKSTSKELDKLTTSK